MTRWYELFAERIHQLVPQVEVVHRRDPIPNDVVLFTFTDAAIPKLETWKLGVITRQVSRTTYEIRYSVAGGGGTRLITRSHKQLSLIYGYDELPPNSSLFKDSLG